MAASRTPLLVGKRFWKNLRMWAMAPFSHGCHLGKGVLIGMNAVIMDDAEIGNFAFVAALAFVKAKFIVAAQKPLLLVFQLKLFLK